MIVDDHVVVREGLTAVLHAEGDIEVVAGAAHGDEALAVYDAHRPEVVLLDVRLPGKGGHTVLAELLARDPGAKVVMVSSQEGDESIFRALKAGARGYVFKKAPSSELVAAVRAAAVGKVAPGPDVAAQLAARVLQAELSAREIEVLRLIGRGLANKEIATELGLSAHTVKNHLSHILEKLQAADRAHALAIALQRGIIEL